MVIANLFSSTHRYAPLITDIKKLKKIKNRLHWGLEVRNGKDLLGQLAQLQLKYAALPMDCLPKFLENFLLD